MMMLAELRITKGHLRIKGQIGYVPQHAWVFSGSVRQNIVFGQTFEEERYNKVIKACALEQVKYTKAVTRIIGKFRVLPTGVEPFRSLVRMLHHWATEDSWELGHSVVLLEERGTFLPICVWQDRAVFSWVWKITFVCKQTNKQRLVYY